MLGYDTIWRAKGINGVYLQLTFSLESSNCSSRLGGQRSPILGAAPNGSAGASPSQIGTE